MLVQMKFVAQSSTSHSNEEHMYGIRRIKTEHVGSVAEYVGEERQIDDQSQALPV